MVQNLTLPFVSSGGWVVLFVFLHWGCLGGIPPHPSLPILLKSLFLFWGVTLVPCCKQNVFPTISEGSYLFLDWCFVFVLCTKPRHQLHCLCFWFMVFLVELIFPPKKLLSYKNLLCFILLFTSLSRVHLCFSFLQHPFQNQIAFVFFEIDVVMLLFHHSCFLFQHTFLKHHLFKPNLLCFWIITCCCLLWLHLLALFGKLFCPT